jgi:AcrR family transcriptional regulator
MSEPVKTEIPARPRGRPRSEAARRAILRAASDLLVEGGVGAVTMEAVAARAGVGKPTLYRHWKDRHEVAMAALIQIAGPPSGPDVGASPPVPPLAALRASLGAVAELFARPVGRSVATMLAAADPSSEVSKAFRGHFIQAKRDEGRRLLEAARARGEVRADLDLEVALDLLFGPLFYRLLMGHGRLNVAFVDSLVDHALGGLGPRQAGSPQTGP